MKKSLYLGRDFRPQTRHPYPLDEEASLFLQFVPQAPLQYCCIRFTVFLISVQSFFPCGIAGGMGENVLVPQSIKAPQGETINTKWKERLNFMQQYSGGPWCISWNNRLASSSKGYPYEVRDHSQTLVRVGADENEKPTGKFFWAPNNLSPPPLFFASALNPGVKM